MIRRRQVYDSQVLSEGDMWVDVVARLVMHDDVLPGVLWVIWSWTKRSGSRYPGA